MDILLYFEARHAVELLRQHPHHASQIIIDHAGTPKGRRVHEALCAWHDALLSDEDKAVLAPVISALEPEMA